jgi:DNA-binding CsgD family transcriptional regulator
MQLGDQSSLPYVLVLLAQVECLLGDLPAARRHADEGCELAAAAGQETVQAYLLAVRAWADAHTGQVDDARGSAVQALAMAGRVGGRPAEQFARAALGLLELSIDHPAAAATWLEPLVEHARAEGIVEPGATRFVPDRIEALLATGRVEEAAELLDWYAANARRLERPSALAAANRCEALLAAAHGDGAAALTAFEQALERHADLPLPFERARTLLAYGGAQRRAKQRRAARATLAEADRAFTRLGMPLWAARAQTELRSIGGRSSRPGELTPTERRVAELAADGQTNREVAAALYLSPKTVEFHLRNVFRKLRLDSRHELARALSGASRAPDQ